MKRNTSSQIIRLLQSMCNILQVPRLSSFINKGDIAKQTRWLCLSPAPEKVPLLSFPKPPCFFKCRHFWFLLSYYVFFFHSFLQNYILMPWRHLFGLLTLFSTNPVYNIDCGTAESFFFFFFYKKESHSGHDRNMKVSVAAQPWTRKGRGSLILTGNCHKHQVW